MRCLFGFMCVLALGVMGCSETAGDGGNGGDGGQGGVGGGVAACVDNVCPCSEAGIRAAIEAGGEDPYTFACDGPLTVTTLAEIVIDNDVKLDGEGNLTVDGDDDHRVFSVPEGVTAQLRGFTVTGGGVYDVGLGDPGIVEGCIDNSGVLTVTDTTLTENRVGIENGGTLTLTNSTVTGGESIFANSGTLTLMNSTVSGNAGEDGIVVTSGMVRLLHTMLSGNVYVRTDPDEPSRAATIVSTATLVSGACVTAEGSTVTWTSNGYNIESPGNTCGFDQTGDLVNITEGQLDLGELADNGGPTETHALGAESLAINHIPVVDCRVETDQRGAPRPVELGCDVGAFEWCDRVLFEWCP